ncbi:hypothetical protein AQ14_1754 [Francisella tularensis subsp. novicida D9876]|nr:hypothetical protein AQ14_1754 [Francisella tularensis subsp. novicida D9876]
MNEKIDTKNKQKSSRPFLNNVNDGYQNCIENKPVIEPNEETSSSGLSGGSS